MKSLPCARCGFVATNPSDVELYARLMEHTAEAHAGAARPRPSHDARLIYRHSEDIYEAAGMSVIA